MESGMQSDSYGPHRGQGNIENLMPASPIQYVWTTHEAWATSEDLNGRNQVGGCPAVSVWSGDSWKVKKESRKGWTGRLGAGRHGEGEKIKEDPELDLLF